MAMPLWIRSEVDFASVYIPALSLSLAQVTRKTPLFMLFLMHILGTQVFAIV